MEKSEHMLDTASKVAGLTRKQYRGCRETEKLEAKKENERIRSVSRIGKGREKQQWVKQREASAERQDKRRAQEEEKRRKERNEKRLQEKEVQKEVQKVQQETNRTETNKTEQREHKGWKESERAKMDAWGKVMTEEKKDRANRKEAERRLKERKDQEEEERRQEAQKKKTRSTQRTYREERQ